MDNFNQNDFNPYENPENNHNSGAGNVPPRNEQRYQTLPRLNYFELAAWACGIASLFSCLTFYGAYVLGALAILFALLSRGGQMTMSRKAKQGLVFGVAAMLLTTVIFIAAFQFALEEYGSLEGIVREFCNIYGYDFDEMYGDLFSQYNSIQQ